MLLYDECNRLRSFAATHIVSGPPVIGSSSSNTADRGVGLMNGNSDSAHIGDLNTINTNHHLTDCQLQMQMQEAVEIMNERGGVPMQLDPLAASTSLTLQDPTAIEAAQKLYSNPINSRGISKASRPLSAALDAALISSSVGNNISSRPVSGVGTKKTIRKSTTSTAAARIRSNGESWVAKNCL